VPEVDTAVRSLTVMWDGSLVVAANNHGTCYVWRLLRGTQVVPSQKYQNDITLLSNITYLTQWSMFLCRQWQTLSLFTSYKHTRDTSSNVFYHPNSVNPTGYKYYAHILHFFIPHHLIKVSYWIVKILAKRIKC